MKISILRGNKTIVHVGYFSDSLKTFHVYICISQVMKTHDANFSDRPILSVVKLFLNRNIAFSNGPYWRRLRRICVNELLSSSRVKYLASIRRDEVYSMLKWISTFSDKSPVRLVEKVGEITNNIVARAAFGGRCKRQKEFLKILKEATEQTSWISPSDLFPWLSWLDMKMARNFLAYYR
jgi:alpha-guaiene 2-oxidase